MAGTKKWFRATTQHDHDGTTPTFENSLVVALPNPGSTLLRTIAEINLSVEVNPPGAGGFEVSWWEDVTAVAGLWLHTGAGAVGSSPTPLTDMGPSTDWLFWEVLTPNVAVYDVSSPHETVTFRPSRGTVDVQTRRKTLNPGVGQVFLAWEFYDPSGLINHLFAGMSYYLGGVVTTSVLCDVP